MRIGMSIIPLLALSLEACASAPLADPALDRDAKTFVPVSDKCSIYVYRDTAFAAPYGLDIWLDGKLAGKIDAFTFYLWRVDPGAHQLLARGENTAMLPVTCAAGEIVYVEQEAQYGWAEPRTSLRRAEPMEAQAAIRNADRAASLLFEPL